MKQGSHQHGEDPRNRDILIYVNGDICPRERAVVSVFDSGFILGDGVWEGLRVHSGRIAFLDLHMDRLYEAAKAIDLDIGLDRAALREALYRTLRANRMDEGVHIRLMVTRGLKSTPYQDPRATIGPATVVIIPEFRGHAHAGGRVFGFVLELLGHARHGLFAPQRAFKLCMACRISGPGTLDSGHTLQRLAEALIFITTVTINLTTLVGMIAAAILGAPRWRRRRRRAPPRRA